ncbi:MAG: FtsQ-type POTRA domain-containing protein [Eubacteriales bacterium]|nr:FtsQ-type POTRA domain-containing protein [Eubacteriales bacterium]
MARQNHSRQSDKASAPRASRPADGRSRSARNSGKQRIRRKRRNQLLFKVICGVMICVVIVLAPTVFFRVSTIRVAGDTRYTQEELIASSGVREGDNMFFLDSGRIADTLYDEYPYLETVTLHRRLPSTLQIEVSERTPALSIESGNDYLLMDMSGKIVEKTSAEAADTVVVTGVDTSGIEVGNTIGEKQEKLLTVLNLMELMTQYELNTEIKSIDIQKAYDVRVQYADRYTILFGNLSELEHKIQFLQAILRESSLPDSGVIDLTDDKEARYRPALESDSSDSDDEKTQEDTKKEQTADNGDSAQDGTQDTESDGNADSTDQEDTQTDDAEQTGDTGQAENVEQTDT